MPREVDTYDGAVREDEEDVWEWGEKEARTLSTTKDSLSRRTPGKYELDEGGEVENGVSMGSRLIRAIEIMLAANEAPAHNKATNPAVLAGVSSGGRIVSKVVVEPSRIAA